MKRPAPQFPVAPVLEELGAVDVPRIRGAGYQKMLCPFHPDTSPSASVSEFGFTCFGCGRQGDAIKLIREEEGVAYQDALRRCEEITGVTDRGGGEPEGQRSGWGALLSE